MATQPNILQLMAAQTQPTPATNAFGRTYQHMTVGEVEDLARRWEATGPRNGQPLQPKVSFADTLRTAPITNVPQPNVPPSVLSRIASIAGKGLTLAGAGAAAYEAGNLVNDLYNQRQQEAYAAQFTPEALQAYADAQAQQPQLYPAPQAGSAEQPANNVDSPRIGYTPQQVMQAMSGQYAPIDTASMTGGLGLNAPQAVLYTGNTQRPDMSQIDSMRINAARDEAMRAMIQELLPPHMRTLGR